MDDAAVVGDECHIVSGKRFGPRFDPCLPSERLDDINNLILLCRVHHKMVDDQTETYDSELLKQIKTKHEGWVTSSLAEGGDLPPIRIRREKDNILGALARIVDSGSLLSVVEGAMAFDFDNDDLETEAELESVSGFIQELQDWGELFAELEARDRVRTKHRVGEILRELESQGFWVFGERESMRLEGGQRCPTTLAGGDYSRLAMLKSRHSDQPVT
jgi:hypothetical protein